VYKDSSVDQAGIKAAYAEGERPIQAQLDSFVDVLDSISLVFSTDTNQLFIA